MTLLLFTSISWHSYWYNSLIWNIQNIRHYFVFFEFSLMYCDLWSQYIKVRTLFKGETIQVVKLFAEIWESKKLKHFPTLFLDSIADLTEIQNLNRKHRTKCICHLYKRELFKRSNLSSSIIWILIYGQNLTVTAIVICRGHGVTHLLTAFGSAKGRLASKVRSQPKIPTQPYVR